ncbi:MAG: AMP-binding protein, partial [Rhodoferax sp.]
MPVSQNSDKVRSQLPRARPVLGGGVPDAYARLHSSFTWAVPETFNIAEVCCARWAAQPDASKNIAIHSYSTRAIGSFYSYAQLQEQANRLSNALVAQGVARGDRVAIVMPQCFETAVAYIAVLQMGAVAMPLSLLFGPDALEYRLQDSEAVVAIADQSSLADLQLARKHCPLLRTVVGVGDLDAVQALADCEYADMLAQF